MKKLAIIWDLDGTLLDSYSSLINSVFNTCNYFKLPQDKEFLYKYFINFSLTDFVNNIIVENKLDRNEFINYYRCHSSDTLKNVGLMKNAKLTLDTLNSMGVQNFIYTHKGDVTDYILDNLMIKDYFLEVVTKLNGFKRKPNSEGVDYLIHKYGLDKNLTFYVGDRKLDIECAINANIKSILFNDPKCFSHFDYGEDYLVTDLFDIVNIVKKEML